MANIFLDQQLMQEVITNKSDNSSTLSSQFFIDFINVIEGWKTKCKNLHWSAPKKNIHVYLDEFLAILSDYQDSIAEDYQGILGQMQPNAVKGTPSETLNAIDFIKEVADKTMEFYSSIPEDTAFVGIKSETETFIHNIYKYTYLFRLTDVRPY